MPKRVYLSVPLITNRNLILARTIADVIKVNDLELASYWVIDDDLGLSKSPTFVYNRDITTLNASDIIVADVSTPSIGVGMEIMYSMINKKHVICLHQKGKPLSRMLLGMSGIIIIEYDTLDELKIELSIMLRQIVAKY